MCSKIFGPAKTPPLVTWPTTKTVMFLPLAICINWAVTARIWATLPIADVTSVACMVWTESIIMYSGWRLSTVARMLSMLVSG